MAITISPYTTTPQPALVQTSQSQFTTSSYASNGISAITGSTLTSPTIKATGDLEVDGDLRIGGVSIKETLAAIQDRLCILVPDPELLSKYEALRQAYEQYKLLEALCK